MERINSESSVVQELVIQLYIAGDSEQNQAVCQRVAEFIEAALRAPYRLDIIDVLDQPDLADLAHVLVTPTLVVRTADSERRLVGDLSDAVRFQLVLSTVGIGE